MLEGTPSRATEKIECEGKGEGELEWAREEAEGRTACSLGTDCSSRGSRQFN